jgi:hypothetical protein
MIDTDKYTGHTEGEWMLDNHDWTWAINIFGNDGETIEANAVLIQDAPKLLAEVIRLRKIIYKCWKDSDHSLYYLQVKLLNDQEHWYQEMMCEDGSCEDDDCECGKGRPWDYTTTEDPWDAEFDKEVE